jgi:thiol-disulfide isomerase/thioredoxin
MLSDQLDPKMDSSLYVQQVRQKIHAMRATKPGQPFLDFVLSDSAGTKHQLSTLIHNDKVLVLDFWASWSGKCLLETDKKIELYNRYFDNGVDFVSISLDVNRLKWLKSIDNQKFPWLQLNDGMGPRGEVAKEYLITGLPVKFILDQEGQILNKVRTVEELEKELKSIYD